MMVGWMRPCWRSSSTIVARSSTKALWISVLRPWRLWMAKSLVDTEMAMFSFRMDDAVLCSSPPECQPSLSDEMIRVHMALVGTALRAMKGTLGMFWRKPPSLP